MKKFFALFFVVLVFSVSCVSATATRVESDNNNETKIIYDTGAKNDNIVYKYKTVGGVLYYRRWNETKQVWVDPDWIRVN